MSNPYTSTPSYGGSFGTHPFATNNSRDSGFQTVPADPSVAQQRLGYSAATPMDAGFLSNAYKVQQEATLPNMGQVVPPNFPPPPFHVLPELLRHFGSSSLPPPPFPPVPIPHLGFNHFASSPKPTTTSTPTFPVVNGSESYNKHQAQTPSPQDHLDGHRDFYNMSREEGELSDGELEDPPAPPAVKSGRPVSADISVPDAKELAAVQSKSSAVEAAPVRFSNLPSAYAPEVSQGNVSTPDRMGPVSQGHSDFENEQANFADNETYNPPSPSTPSSERPVANTNEQSPQISHSIARLMDARTENSGDIPRFLCEQVKHALRSLQAHRINFDDLVKEGVDPYVLRRVYDDIGNTALTLKPASPVAEQSPVVEHPLLAEQPLLVEQPPAVDQPPIVEQSPAVEQPPADDSYISVPPGPEPLHTLPIHSPEKSFSLPQPGMTADPALNSTPDISILEPVEASAPSKTLGSAPIGQLRTEKTPMSPPPSVTAMERKDRIAQLLAAKTGKTTSPRHTSESVSQLPAKMQKPQPAVDAAQKSPPPQEKTIPPPSEAAAKMKNKAQTELIRQKMAALRKETLAKAQAHATDDAKPVEPPPALTNPSRSVQHPQSIPATDTSDSGSGLQIPGLFMATEGLEHEQGGTDTRAEESASNKVVEPVDTDSAPNVARRESTTNSDKDVEHPPVKPRTPVRLPQKRPLASDSFNEPRPSPKAPFRRRESRDKVELVISDTESGEIDDVEMDLDDDSEDDQPGPKKDNDESAMPLPECKIPRLSPSMELPPKPVEPNSNGMATPTSTKAQAFEENDKGKLWKAKQQEIELIRRKIAEMEEKQKAKQNGTPTVSDNGARKTVLPVIRTSLSRPASQVAQAAVESASMTNADPLPLAPALVPAYVPASAPVPALLDSPVLAASRPEELPSTPSTPLSSIREPVKATELRQKLLRGKATREGTPIAADVEFRRAKLAEKRARLEELRREAAKREAEIREESELLEAQVQGGVDEDTVDAQASSTEDHDLQHGATPREQNENISLPSNDDARHDDFEERMSIRSDVRSQSQSFSVAHSADDAFQSTDLLTTSSIEQQRFLEEPNPADVEGPIANGPPPAPGTTQWDLQNGSFNQYPVTDTILPSNPNLVFARDEDAQLHIQSRPASAKDTVADPAQSESFDPDPADEDGSVSMSDSGADDYEPAEPDPALDRPESCQTEEHFELYEPAEVTILADVPPSAPIPMLEETSKNIGAVGLSTGSNLLAPELADPQLNLTTSMDDVADDMHLTEPGMDNSVQTTPPSHAQERDVNLGDDASHQSHVETIQHHSCPAGAHFTPYETPRRFFKNFRYHDRFPELVPNGYKSLTFSNNINSRKPFCPTELAGQECQDVRCDMQHFRQVELTDDKILAQMSTADNLKSKAEQDRWVTGLHQVIAELRGEGVKDFHMVARALAAYRRRFPEELSTISTASSQS